VVPAVAATAKAKKATNPLSPDLRAVKDAKTAIAMTTIRLDTNLADEAAKVLGVKTRTEAVHTALKEVVALERFKKLMRKHAGKLSFEGHP
jgi:Arc/MetJ family transcription regulator